MCITTLTTPVLSKTYEFMLLSKSVYTSLPLVSLRFSLLLGIFI